MTNSETFNKELGYISNANFREFVSSTLDNLPDYFRTVGASTSGKYHPAYTLGEGGLIRHVRAATGIAKELFRAEIYPFGEFEQDVVISALILHDGLKCGMWEDNTAFNHPLLMKEFLLINFNDGELEKSEYNTLFVQRTADCIESHMGKWNTNSYWNLTLPLPKNDMQKCVHLCDYLASRKNLEYKFDIEGSVD